MNTKIVSLITGVGLIVGITVFVTLFNGFQTGRWGVFRGIGEARTVLKAVPLQMGNWQAEGEGELDQVSINMLRIQDSYIVRTYKNPATQATVRLTLMVGPTGKITTHTPEICFGGKDFKKDATRVSVPIDVQLLSGDKEIVDTFWLVTFTGQSLDTNNRVSFYYAVSNGGAWNAVENPRATFQMYRYVYKIQAEAYSAPDDEEDTVKKFLIDCLPAIHEHLHPCR